jgi:hypothetical protein
MLPLYFGIRREALEHLICRLLRCRDGSGCGASLAVFLSSLLSDPPLSAVDGVLRSGHSATVASDELAWNGPWPRFRGQLQDTSDDTLGGMSQKLIWALASVSVHAVVLGRQVASLGLSDDPAGECLRKCGSSGLWSRCDVSHGTIRSSRPGVRLGASSHDGFRRTTPHRCSTPSSPSSGPT